MRKIIFRYLKEHYGIFLLWLVNFCILILVFYLYHLPLAAVLYPISICTGVSLAYAGRCIFMAYKKHERMTKIQKLTSDSIWNEFSDYKKTEDKDYQSIIQSLYEEIHNLEEQMTSMNRETMDYFTVWVHQVKTPIASMRLHLEGEDSKASRQISSDLLHIEQYVEMVLTYLRMGSETTDYVFHEVEIDKLVKENLRKLRGDFIIKRLTIQYETSGTVAVTDEKWLSFVVSQILSNALKYTREGSISIGIELPKTLCICDTGIGIAPEDLPRIFEKGFTGRNGRNDKNASGLGLYLCKEICNKLGHRITAESELNVGTTVRIDLSRYHYSME